MLFRALLRQQEQNPVYYIRGKSSILNGTESFVISYRLPNNTNQNNVTEKVPTDAEGNWEIEYTGKKILSLQSFAFNKSTLLTCDLTAADDFAELTNLGASGLTYGAFRQCSNLTSVTFGSGHVWGKLVSCRNLFQLATSLTSADIGNIDFSKVTDCYRMCYQTKLTAIDFGNQDLAKVSSWNEAFALCANLTSVNMRYATLEAATNTVSMFQYCSLLTSLDLSNATFANVANTTSMFQYCSSLTSLDLSNATFAKANTNTSIFSDCTALVILKLPKANFSQAAALNGFVRYCNALTTIKCGPAQTYGNPSASNIPFNSVESPLSYQSIYDIAVWLCDKTGQSSARFTVNRTAWNALTAAEQTTIIGIVTSKNWNLATA